MSSDSLESLRRSYRPDQVRLLLVGESPPASGLFFYCANSPLYRVTRDAFARVYERDWWPGGEFLEFFRSVGCYVDDLCLEPVNDLGVLDRERERRLAVEGLADRIQSYAPRAIASVMREIHGYVSRAASLAGRDPAMVTSLPFPFLRHARTYTDTFEDLLRRLIAEGVLTREVGESR